MTIIDEEQRATTDKPEEPKNDKKPKAKRKPKEDSAPAPTAELPAANGEGDDTPPKWFSDYQAKHDADMEKVNASLGKLELVTDDADG